MPNQYELTKTALDTLTGWQYAANAFLSDEANPLPDEYIVSKMVSNPVVQNADNEAKLRFVRMQLSIFKKDGLIDLPDTDTAMKAQGFSVSDETELPFNDKTRHFGIAREYTIYIETP
jgi:hypothetical protein